MAVCAHGKTCNAVATTHCCAVVKDIENLTADGETDRLLASGRNAIDQTQTILPNPEDRDVVTAGVHRKQELIGSINGQRPLIPQPSSSAGASGGNHSGKHDLAIRRAAECQYCISTARIVECIDRSSRGERRETTEGDDGG